MTAARDGHGSQPAPGPSGGAGDRLVVAHSSDLHLGSGYGHDHELEKLLAAALAARADVLLLAGDVFDHNRVPLAQLDWVARQLGEAPMQVLILPGNHDCLETTSVYRSGGLAEPENVRVLGVTDGESALFPALDLTIWGRPHAEYANMSPLVDVPSRQTKWQIATAHGHWVAGPSDFGRSWLITGEQVEAADADYIALGHWDRACMVGTEKKAAYYSGSPDLARSFNLVTLSAAESPTVERVPLVDQVDATQTE